MVKTSYGLFSTVSPTIPRKRDWADISAHGERINPCVVHSKPSGGARVEAHCLPFAVLLLTSCIFAKKKNTLSNVIVNAKYVMVTSQFGENPSDSRLTTEDRNAVGAVQEAIQKWGRYTLVFDRNAADIVILVRTGGYLRVERESLSVNPHLMRCLGTFPLVTSGSRM